MLRAVAAGTGGSGSGGDVIGPGASTLNATARFADTAGTLLKDSPFWVTTDAGVSTILGTSLAAPGFYVGLTGDTVARVSIGVNANDLPRIGFGPGGASARDLFLQRGGAASLRFGAEDAAAPVAQNTMVQSVVAGTTDVAGALWTLKDSVGTGTGASGGFAWQTAAASTTGNTQNSQTTKMTLTSTGALVLSGGTVAASAPAIDAAQTWNNAAVTFTGAKINVTNTNSAAGSLLLDVQVGGVSGFNVTKTGAVAMPGNINMGSGSTNPQATLNGGTATTSLPPLTVSQTWNAGAVTFTGAVVNMTSTASAAASRFIDFQLAGVSQLYVRKDGALVPPGDWTIAVPSGNTLTMGAGVINTSASGAIIRATSTSGSFQISTDLILGRAAAATLVLGGGNSSSPVAQTIRAQGSSSGSDNNIGGGNLTIQPGLGTGIGTPANLILNGIVGTTTGTGAQAASAGLTIAGVGTGQLPSVVLGSAAIATNATDGFLYAVSGAGTPTGVPTAYTGRVPIYVDTTNSSLWMYLGGAWKQPKTPAGAAIVSWQ